MKFQNIILDILRVLPKRLIQYLAGPPILIDGNALDPNVGNVKFTKTFQLIKKKDL